MASHHCSAEAVRLFILGVRGDRALAGRFAFFLSGGADPWWPLGLRRLLAGAATDADGMLS